ncbi:possible 5-valerolactone hydrolase (plasmid) [Rhodococcus jostii RHA1]|uniref:Possible 5-valerolactone hydrolase n=1 Tax=Rhodococcus jostii (strain RHA1) TaxID=101510 RepID=Q0RXG0_RHOJR|nr:SMP-30/gluconolactonase/LRE family protein [Rhodococcus jostii]ABH00026.1 possible 5-valerolactone hydrolase [Rhodococcus jostii RHA1]
MTNAVADAVANARIFEARQSAQGFSWPECPRWHDDLFWFSDMYTSTLKTIDESGTVRVVVDATGRAPGAGVPIVLGGFGWLPDGRMVVTSMHEKLVLVHDGSSPTDLSVYADLSAFAPGPVNDMVVAADGHVYVTQLGFDLFNGAEPAPSPIIVVSPAGTASTADAIGPLMGANGIAISEDGSRVFTAEAFANRIIVMDRATDGTLSGNRVFADCPFLPDGIGLDAEGGVWAAMPGSGYVARFIDGGTITDAVAVPLESGVGSACLLGGPDRRTLYITVGMEVFDFEKSAREAKASVWTAQVDVGAGRTRP